MTLPHARVHKKNRKDKHRKLEQMQSKISKIIFDENDDVAIFIKPQT